MIPVPRRIVAAALGPQSQATAIQLAGAAFSFLAYAVIARTSGPSISGQYAIMVQTVIAASAIALFGHDQLLARGIAASLATAHPGAARHQVGVLGRTTLALLGAMAIILLVGRPLLEDIGMAHDALLLVPLATIFYGSLRFFVAALRGTMMIRLSQLFLTLQPLILIAGVLVLLLAGRERHVASALAWMYTGSLMLPAVIALAVFSAIARGWPRRPERDAPAAVSDRTSLGLSVVAMTVFGWANLAILGRYIDPAAMGIYQMCFQLHLPFAMVFTTYSMAVGPELAQALARGERAHAMELFRGHRRFLLSITGLPLIGIFVFAPQVLGLFGQGFVEGAGALRVIMAAMAINMVFATSTVVLVMDNRDRAYLGVTLASIALAAIPLALFLPTHGIIAAAYALLVQAIVIHGGAYWWMRRKLDRPGSGASNE